MLRPAWITFILLASSPFFTTRLLHGETPADAEQEILSLYQSGKLFDKAQYKLVRAAFTHRFKQKLAGKPYTLANIRKDGGVCAQQADFAARVAKSVGVPAVSRRSSAA